MKKYFFYCMILIMLVSCESKTPIIDGSKPFIVNSIIDVGNGMSKYIGPTSACYTSKETFNALSPEIVLPSRMYNIGDTITFKHK